VKLTGFVGNITNRHIFVSNAGKKKKKSNRCENKPVSNKAAFESTFSNHKLKEIT
jgi:hypothetical protein